MQQVDTPVKNSAEKVEKKRRKMEKLPDDGSNLFQPPSPDLTINGTFAILDSSLRNFRKGNFLHKSIHLLQTTVR